MVVVVVMGLMVKDTRILVVGPLKSWLRVPQKVMPRNPDKLAHAKSGRLAGTCSKLYQKQRFNGRDSNRHRQSVSVRSCRRIISRGDEKNSRTLTMTESILAADRSVAYEHVTVGIPSAPLLMHSHSSPIPARWKSSPTTTSAPN